MAVSFASGQWLQRATKRNPTIFGVPPKKTHPYIHGFVGSIKSRRLALPAFEADVVAAGLVSTRVQIRRTLQAPSEHIDHIGAGGPLAAKEKKSTPNDPMAVFFASVPCWLWFKGKPRGKPRSILGSAEFKGVQNQLAAHGERVLAKPWSFLSVSRQLTCSQPFGGMSDFATFLPTGHGQLDAQRRGAHGTATWVCVCVCACVFSCFPTRMAGCHFLPKTAKNK